MISAPCKWKMFRHKIIQILKRMLLPHFAFLKWPTVCKNEQKISICYFCCFSNFPMSISHNWVVYSPKIMTKRRRKCKLRCESIVVILVISLYSILSWYQVKDLQDYYAALGNFCALSLFFYALIKGWEELLFCRPAKKIYKNAINSLRSHFCASIYIQSVQFCQIFSFSASNHRLSKKWKFNSANIHNFKEFAYCSQGRNQEIFLGETKPIRWG